MHHFNVQQINQVFWTSNIFQSDKMQLSRQILAVFFYIYGTENQINEIQWRSIEFDWTQRNGNGEKPNWQKRNSTNENSMENLLLEKKLGLKLNLKWVH